MLQHNFDEIIDRRNTDSKKYSTEFYPADVIPMWIADTDFKSPQPVIDALTERIKQGVYGYTPASQRLKKAAQGWIKKRYQWEIPEDAVEFIPGVISGVISAVRALSRPGDNIVIHTPCYLPFTELAAHNGRHLLRSAMLLQNGRYEIDFADLEQKLSDPRSRLFILCNPQNPTGRVFSKEELLKIGELCLKHHVTILSDEIHGDIVYTGHKHIPFASLSPAFAEHTITFINPSKTFNVPGFRTAAYITTNKLLQSYVHEVIVNNKAFGENICGTLAFCTAYESCDYYADQLVAYLEKNRQLSIEAFQEIEKIDLIAPEGTYLFWLDCRKLGFETQDALYHFFTDTAKIGVNNGTAFGIEGKGFVRMNVGCPKATLEKALSQLKNAVASL